MSHRSSINGTKHPYLRDELWLDGTLVFWNTDGHNRKAYEPFINRIRKRFKHPKEKVRRPS